jgi:hypothetical protein
MIQFLRKPINIFFVLFIVLLLVFCLLPINIFDGAIVYQKGITKFIEPRPLSLHFILDFENYKEIFKKEMPGWIIIDKYLTAKGYAMAAIFIIGIPALAAYRLHLGKNRNTNK